MGIDATTKVYCIIGNPVAHSMSPAIHNAAFAEVGVNAVYVGFRVENLPEAISGFRALGLWGASVTIPHKVALIPLLDKVDDVARMIGAVNTIVREDDKLVGYNTDGPGAVRALKDGGVVLEGRRVTIIGSGGASRAVAFTLAARENIKTLNVLGVIGPELEKLTGELRKNSTAKIEGQLIDDKILDETIKNTDVLINASPVGMHPDEDKSPVPASLLRKELDVFDVVYNPLETKFIREAKKTGCRAVLGVEMFIAQGVLQFEMWTGQKAPVGLMRKIVLERLQGKPK